METERKLDRLKEIETVDVPPYLLQSIKKRIQGLQEVEAPILWKLAFVTCTVIILFLNVLLIIDGRVENKTSQIGTVVSALQLSGNNQLYND
ncbi:MAG: hypothetical protein EOO91_03555 [Pedobacter sp.]|nr:MAG: hypothetical protein EOO91_03555 [Pedobacter sp.]